MTALPPSGKQVELRFGEQRAVIVEVGGGLRRYDIGDRRVLDGYPRDELASGGRGQVLLPWPNRLAGGRWYDDAGLDGDWRQLPLSEPDRGNAIHGLVRWSAWDVQPEGFSAASATHTLVPRPGYPFRLSCRIDYVLGPSGLSVTTTIRNAGARPAPFGLGFHPYLAACDALVDDLTLTVPAATRLLLDQGIPTGTAPVEGSPLDFRDGRRIGAALLDDAFTEVARSPGGAARVTVDEVTLWAGPGFDYVQVFTGDTLAPERRRRGLAVEPMTSPPNALATGEGLRWLDPGAAAELAWGIDPG